MTDVRNPGLTPLQRFIIQALVEDLRVDPDDGSRLGIGLTAQELADRSGGWYGNPTIVRALNALCRASWARQVDAPGVPTVGPRRQWVATPDGAAQVGA
jgi:hypothetical protein